MCVTVWEGEPELLEKHHFSDITGSSKPGSIHSIFSDTLTSCNCNLSCAWPRMGSSSPALPVEFLCSKCFQMRDIKEQDIYFDRDYRKVG